MSYAHVDGLPGYAEEDEEPAWKIRAELDKVTYEIEALQAKIDKLEEKRDKLLERLGAVTPVHDDSEDEDDWTGSNLMGG